MWYVPLEAVSKVEAQILTPQFAVEQGPPSSVLHLVFTKEGTYLAVVLVHIKAIQPFAIFRMDGGAWECLVAASRQWPGGLFSNMLWKKASDRKGLQTAKGCRTT